MRIPAFCLCQWLCEVRMLGVGQPFCDYEQKVKRIANTLTQGLCIVEKLVQAWDYLDKDFLK